MTKEKILLVTLAITMILIAMVPTGVKATQEEVWTDFTNAKLEIKPNYHNVSEDDATLIDYKIKISNVKLNPNNSYSIYFHWKDTEINKNKVLFHSQAVMKKGETETQISLLESFLTKNQDIYVSILERKNDSTASNDTNLVVTSQKIERPELLPKLGNRINIYFSKASTSTFLFVPNIDENARQYVRNIKVKVGKITDNEILKQIKENKAVGLQSLLSYAKKAKEYNYTGTIKYNLKTDGNSGITESLTSKFNLQDGDYYFAYIELDDENGIYYPVEDIALYRAKGTTDLIRYSDKEFVWDIKEEVKQEETNKEEIKQEETKKEEVKQEETKKEEVKKEETKQEVQKDKTQANGKLPQTGEEIICTVGITLFIVLAGIGYIKYRQYKDL